MVGGDRDGFYLGAGAGLSFSGNSDIDGTGINTSADLDETGSFSGMFGHAYANGLRAELEFGYRNSDVDGLTGAANPQGDIGALHLMVNGYYDWQNSTAFTPYLGAGIGAARVDFDGVNPVGGSTLDDSGTVFAYQGIAGVSYTLSDQFDLFADYRYMGALESDLKTNAGTIVDADFEDHRIMVGLRFFFGGKQPMPKPEPKRAAAPAPAPPPPPPPPPPPAPKSVEVPRNYLIFFDWDQSTLRPEALAIIQAAADNVKKGGLAKISATGHADRSGPDRYNLGLSERRAEAVKAELVRLGIAAPDIAVAWKGEREPLVATPDGVREPQNRRVEVVLE